VCPPISYREYSFLANERTPKSLEVGVRRGAEKRQAGWEGGQGVRSGGDEGVFEGLPKGEDDIREDDSRV
jgi:hypothetical protein